MREMFIRQRAVDWSSCSFSRIDAILLVGAALSSSSRSGVESGRERSARVLLCGDSDGIIMFVNGSIVEGGGGGGVVDHNSTTNDVSSDGSMFICAAYDKYTTLRFCLIVGASFIAIMGATTNITLVFIFFRLSRVSDDGARSVIGGGVEERMEW